MKRNKQEHTYDTARALLFNQRNWHLDRLQLTLAHKLAIETVPHRGAVNSPEWIVDQAARECAITTVEYHRAEIDRAERAINQLDLNDPA